MGGNMARIFISHSSKDNLEAIAFRNWLLELGYAPNDVFLDLHSLGAGERWRDALRAANRRCEAVVLLASEHALASQEVHREITLAEEYHKPILIGLLEGLDIDNHADSRLTRFRDLQLIDLAAEPRDASLMAEHEAERRAIHFNRTGLEKLEARLRELGLEANSFAWTPEDLGTANPYPGLRGYTEDEAGLFFGRDPDIARGLAKLRELRATEDGRLLVIQAASGAGKSSFLKAGLWPRLRRDGEFEPVAILRPAGGAISGPYGMARALSAWLAASNLEAPPAGTIAEALMGDIDTASLTFETLIDRIHAQAENARRVAVEDAPAPSLVIGLDQAEELFAASDAEESRQLIRLLSRLAARSAGVKPLVIMTLRAESVGALMSATEEALLPTSEFLPLPPIPRWKYGAIISQPTKVASEAGLQISIEPQLVGRLIEDSFGADAMPLLAFTLARLYDGRLDAERLTLQDYHRLGAMRGAIEAAAQEAREDAVAKGAPQNRIDALLRQTFLPHLVRINEARKFACRLARREELPDEAAPVVEALLQMRLLTADRRSIDGAVVDTVEIAHEAILREWPLLADWLEAERGFLEWRSQIAVRSAQHEAGAGDLLTGHALEVAQAWLGARTENIPEDERKFIELSAQEASRNRSRRGRRQPTRESKAKNISKNQRLYKSRADEVVCSAFSPSSTRENKLLVQICFYHRSESSLVEKIAQNMDKESERQALDISIDPKHGQQIQVTIEAGNLEIDQRSFRFVWIGERVWLYVELSSYEEIKHNFHMVNIRVFLEDFPTGIIRFPVRFLDANMPIFRHNWTRYSRAFISYARKDAIKALDASQILRAVGVEVFQDILGIEPGKRWKKELFKQIDESDVFILFWSRAARESEWVIKEACYAAELHKKYNSPDFIPYILEGPEPISPPDELREYNFFDPIRCVTISFKNESIWRRLIFYMFNL